MSINRKVSGTTEQGKQGCRSRKQTYSEMNDFTLYFYVLEALLMLDLMNSVSKGLRNAISWEMK